MSAPHDHTPNPLEKRKPTAPPPPPAPEQQLEDPGSVALSEALRSSFVIVKVIMVILVVVFFASGFFTVSSQERAIILRFGRPIGTGEQQLLGPGAHWSFPYPIDEVVRIPYTEFQTVQSTVGWFAITPEEELAGQEPMALPTLNPATEGYTLTADNNILHVRATLRYRVNEPLNYALNFVNASNLVQNALNNALFYASAQYKVDEALRGRISEFKETIALRVAELAQQQQLGIVVEQVDLITRPPLYVKEAFAAVFNAEAERRATNETARAYANQIYNRALGESNSIVNLARAESARIVQELAAEADYFNNQLPHYEQNPELFAERLRLESLARVMTNVQEKLYFQSGQPWLQLSREPLKRPQRQQPGNQ